MVTCVTDLTGATSRIVCSEFEEPTGICRLKKRAFEGGPLSQLLERAADQMLDSRSTRCDLQ
jgi:hypothetical protein